MHGTTIKIQSYFLMCDIQFHDYGPGSMNSLFIYFICTNK